MKNTDNYVCKIFDLLVRGYKPIINNKDKMYGKIYRTTKIMGKDITYKTVYNGSRGHLLISDCGHEYTSIPMSKENILFIMSLCRIYHKLIEGYTITKDRPLIYNNRGKYKQQ